MTQTQYINFPRAIVENQTLLFLWNTTLDVWEIIYYLVLSIEKRKYTRHNTPPRHGTLLQATKNFKRPLTKPRPEKMPEGGNLSSQDRIIPQCSTPQSKKRHWSRPPNSGEMPTCRSWPAWEENRQNRQPPPNNAIPAHIRDNGHCCGGSSGISHKTSFPA